MPARMTYTLFEDFNAETNELTFLASPFFQIDDNMIAWDMVQLDCQDHSLCTHQIDSPVIAYHTLNADGTVANFKIKLDDIDSDQTGDAYLVIVGGKPDIPGTYTLTIE